MPPEVERPLPPGLSLILGPPHSGKTEALLGIYRAALREGLSGSCLWLSPTARSAAETRARLLGPDLPACLSPGVMTFDGFATSLVRAARDPIRPIGPVQVRQLLERLASEAHARGELEYFGPIADTSGFVELLARFVAELKRLEIWPDEYARICGERHPTQKDRELALLYGRYQEWLNRGRLYDSEGRFWWARTLLREEPGGAGPSYRVVVADGFTDFTYTQHEIIELLSGRADRLLISLPLESEDVRRDLFHKCHATLADLQQRHPDATIVELPRQVSIRLPALAHLERELFRAPRRQRSIDRADEIEIVAAPGQLAELQWVARSIKELLLHGDPRRGGAKVRPDEIVVVLRGVHDSGALVSEVFAEYGLPLALEASPSLDRVPALSAILGLLRLAIDDWPHEDVLAVTSNGYFRPKWPEWRDGKAARDIDWIVRDQQIPSGRELLREQVARWAQDVATESATGTTDTEPPADIASTVARKQLEQRRLHAARALPCIDRLIKALAELPDSATEGQWAAALQRLAEAIDFGSALEDDPTGRDLEAWRRLLAALVAGGELSRQLGQSPRHLDGRELLEFAGDLCRWERLPGGGSESGRVRVLAAESVRGLRVPYLFFAGLSESSFPRHRESALHGRREIDNLRSAGLRFDPPFDRAEDEMLLFYEVVTRATRRLVLSYPALDGAAQPMLPSPYLTEVERACGPGRIVRHQPSLSSFEFPAGEPMSPREHRVRAVWQALDGSIDRLATLLRAGDRLSQNVRAAWRMNASRDDRGEFGRFEGLVLGEAALAELAKKFDENNCWTASALEQYAYCPYQFFLKQVLALEPLAELRLEIDFLERGRVLHDALATVYRRIGSANSDPALAQPEKFRAEFDRVLDELHARQIDSGPMTHAWQAIDRRVLSRWCENYLNQVAGRAEKANDRDAASFPAYFEVSFGIPAEATQAPSVAQPLRLAQGDEVVLLRGRIDRIDVALQHGKTLVSVVDYKGSSGRNSGTNAELDRTSLQADLYAVAAAELILAERQAIPVASGYWYLRGRGYVPTFQEGGKGDWATFEARRQRLTEIVLELARGARRGEYPVHSADQDCTGRCSYGTVCRVNQVRSLEKQWPAPRAN